MSASHQTATAHRTRLGQYIRDGTRHTVLACRAPDGPWQLLDSTGDDVTVIETLYPDEGEGEVRAIAELYLREMRS